jgi:hypothetical protein
MLGTLSCLLLRKSKVKDTLQKSSTLTASLEISLRSICHPKQKPERLSTIPNPNIPEAQNHSPIKSRKQTSRVPSKERKGFKIQNASNEVVIFIVP